MIISYNYHVIVIIKVSDHQRILYGAAVCVCLCVCVLCMYVCACVCVREYVCVYLKMLKIIFQMNSRKKIEEKSALVEFFENSTPFQKFLQFV